MSILDGLDAQQRVVYLKVRRQVAEFDASLIALSTNFEAAEAEFEAATAVLEKVPSAETQAQVAECGERLRVLGEQLVEKRTQFQALEAQLLADSATHDAAVYYFAELRKTEVTREKGEKVDRRSVGGGENITLKYRLNPSAIIDSGEFSPTYVPEVVLTGHISDAAFQKKLAVGTTVQPADIAAVFVNIRDELVYLLSQGYSVSFGDMFIMKPGLRGTCLDKKTEANQRRKFLPVVNVRMMPKFAADVRKRIEIGLSREQKKGPVITGLSRSDTTKAPDTLYPGVMTGMTGRQLGFNPDEEDEGVFFTLSKSPYTVYRLTQKGRGNMINPSEVVFVPPLDLPSGAVGRLSISKRLRNSQILRVYDYTSPVVVA